VTASGWPAPPLSPLSLVALAAVLYAGDDVGDLDAMAEVHAWARRSGRPGRAVAVGPAGGPLAGTADMTVADPRGLLAFLEGLL
jgi:hypothetical protein